MIRLVGILARLLLFGWIVGVLCSHFHSPCLPLTQLKIHWVLHLVHCPRFMVDHGHSSRWCTVRLDELVIELGNEKGKEHVHLHSRKLKAGIAPS